MQIKITRSITVNSGYILAEVSCFLPTKNTDLHDVLVRLDRNIWGFPLGPRCGVWEPEECARCVHVQKSFPLAIDSIPLAIEWIQEKTDEAITSLQEVLNEYRTIAKSLPTLDPVYIDIKDIEDNQG